MKLPCLVIVVLLGHQVLTKPRKVELKAFNPELAQVKDPEEIRRAVTIETEVTTDWTWAIQPRKENAAPVNVTGETEVTTGWSWVIQPRNENNKQNILLKNIQFGKPRGCGEDEFLCDTDMCMSEVKRCDGRVNCADGTDEDDCEQVIKAEEAKKMEVRQGCGGEISETSGSINHPNGGGNYQDNEDCTWIIRAGQPIKITFTRLQVEICCDSLTIRDGETSGSSVLGEFKGSTIPESVETTGNTAHLHFSSDYSVSYSGFEIKWEPLDSTGCGGEISETSGSINHPNGGGNYQDNEDCTWIINAGQPIKITFTRLQVERCCDSLTIRDGDTSGSSVLGEFKGSTIPESVETTGNTAHLHFASDYSVSYTGFEIKWEPLATDPTCQCGVANTARIVGGTEVNPKRKYPWQVGLKIPGYWISCGGTIINDRWILTAAHCITDQDTCEYDYNPGTKVLVGDHHQFEQTDDVSDTKQYSIKSWIKHPDYNLDCRSTSYDFALLELTEAIPFNSVIRPICLPEDDSETYVGRTGTVTGWGSTNNEGDLSEFLQVVQVPILANDQCGDWPTLAAMKMCAGGEVGKDSCGGDSGGPMYVVENNKYIQVGVVSYGHKVGCASTEYPGIYARVSKVLPWITETTSNGKKCD